MSGGFLESSRGFLEDFWPLGNPMSGGESEGSEAQAQPPPQLPGPAGGNTAALQLTQNPPHPLQQDTGGDKHVNNSTFRLEFEKVLTKENSQEKMRENTILDIPEKESEELFAAEVEELQRKQEARKMKRHVPMMCLTLLLAGILMVGLTVGLLILDTIDTRISSAILVAFGVFLILNCCWKALCGNQSVEVESAVRGGGGGGGEVLSTDGEGGYGDGGDGVCDDCGGGGD